MNIIKTTDHEIIARLNKDVHQIYSKLYPEYFKEYNFDEISNFFKEIIHKPRFTFLVLENDNTQVGYAWVEIMEYKENVFKKSYKSVWVHQICVLSTERGKGYGSKLMEKVYEIAKENHISKIELEYWSDNINAKEFYLHRGFVKYREFVYKEIS